MPDGTVYYMHPTLRVVTDIELRNQKKLDAVTSYFEDDESLKRGKSAGKGREMWLRDAETKKGRFRPLRMWVDHKARSVSHDGLDEAREDRRCRRFEWMHGFLIILFFKVLIRNTGTGLSWRRIPRTPRSL